jgi:hypothetical protein
MTAIEPVVAGLAAMLTSMVLFAETRQAGAAWQQQAV